MRFFRRKPKPPVESPKESDKRSQYRALPGKKHSVTMRVMDPAGEPQPAELFDLSAGGAAIALTAENDPGHKVGDELTLIFSSIRAAKNLSIQGCVANRISGDWGTRYGVQFKDLEAFFENLDQVWFHCFNRRRITRALPALDHRIPLVFGDEAADLNAKVLNLSPEGLGALATGDTAEMLDTVAQVGVLVDSEIVIRKGVSPISVGLTIRHRRPTPAGLVIGASFELQEDAEAESHLSLLTSFTQERLKEVALWNKADEK